MVGVTGVVLYQHFEASREKRHAVAVADAQSSPVANHRTPPVDTPEIVRANVNPAPSDAPPKEPVRRSPEKVTGPARAMPLKPPAKEAVPSPPALVKRKTEVKEVRPKSDEPTPKEAKPPKAEEPLAKLIEPPIVNRTVDPANPEIGGKTLAQWIAEIPSEDRSKGDTAIRMVLRFGPERALAAAPILINELKGHTAEPMDGGVRVNATNALGLILGGAAKPSPAVVNHAVTAIKSTLGDSQAMMKFRAVEALGRIGPAARPAIPLLLGLIHDPNSWETRQAVAAALGTIALDRTGKMPPPHVAILSLKAAVADSAAPVRLAAIKSLALLGAASGKNQRFEVLGFMLAKAKSTNEDPVVRVWAHLGIMYLSNDVSAALVGALAGYLKHPRTSVRVQAAKALGVIGPKAGMAIPQLVAELNDKEDVVAASCIEALASVGKESTQALSALRRIAADMDRHQAIRQAAAHALKLVTEKR